MFWQLSRQGQSNMGFDKTAEFFGTNFPDNRQAKWLDTYIYLSPALSTA